MEINYTSVLLMHYMTAICMFGISSLIATIKEEKMHPGVHSVNSIKLAHYSQKNRYPFGYLFFCYAGRTRTVGESLARSPNCQKETHCAFISLKYRYSLNNRIFAINPKTTNAKRKDNEKWVNLYLEKMRPDRAAERISYRWFLVIDFWC